MMSIMKKLVVLLVVLVSQPAWAGCESSIIEGSHVAIKKAEAKSGAWEEARDACYPGEATKLSVSCKKVSGTKGVQGKKSFQCQQEVSCNICGEDLTRKYEAMN